MTESVVGLPSGSLQPLVCDTLRPIQQSCLPVLTLALDCCLYSLMWLAALTKAPNVAETLTCCLPLLTLTQNVANNVKYAWLLLTLALNVANTVQYAWLLVTLAPTVVNTV